uniref:Gustatory receptor n=1 Tax=Tetranychus urticae TaxID=32264 RepID=T1KLJ2_TETUR
MLKFFNSPLTAFAYDFIKAVQLNFDKRLHNYDCEQLAFKSLETQEKQVVFTLTLRHGFEQSVDKIIKMRQKIDFGNLLLRIASLVNLVRIILLFSVSYETAIYLGDPLLDSKDRNVLLLVVLVGLTPMYIVHELAVIKENNYGFVSAASDLKVVIKNGFSYFPFVGLEKKPFCRFIYLICAFHNMITPMMIPFITFLYNFELFCNLYNNYSLKTMLFAIPWSFTLTTAVIFLAAQAICYSSICCIYVGLHYFHIKSITNATGFLLQVNDKRNCTDLNCIIGQTLWLFNKIDSTFREIRFIVLFFYNGIALMSCWFLHFGLFTGNHSVVMDFLITWLGFMIISDILAISFFCAAFTNKVDRLYPMWHRMYCKSKTTTAMKLKMIEIFNRIILPTNGIQIGDYGLITKKFVLIFLLEFSTSLMLLRVNFGSYF